MEQISKHKKIHHDFIDLAKGLCILLVVSYHVDQGNWLYSNEVANSFFFSFRIPLYFILSGLFLSFRSGAYPFFIKKVNKLVIPFVFFYLLSCLFGYLHEFVYAQFMNGGSYKEIYNLSIVNFIVNENLDKMFPNNPIWFLVSLFTTYMFYMALHYMCKGNLLLISAMSMLLGSIGFFLSCRSFNLPMYLDSSLTCMPFVVAGVVLKRSMKLLEPDKKMKCLLVSVVCFFIVLIICNGVSIFYMNRYECNIVSLYTSGILGSCGIIYLAKCINKVKGINYIGRYSIIVLGTHYLFYTASDIILSKLPGISVQIHILISFLVTIIICSLAIYLFKKYLPCFVAQKDLIKV